MELVGQMYKLSACFDTPNEYKGLPYDYFPEDAVTYGSTICSFGLPYNDHNYGMPTGLTPPVMAPHLMDPVPKPKKATSSLLTVKSESTNDLPLSGCAIIKSALSPASSTTTTYRSSDSTPRKAYLDENDYPVYVEPEIKVVEVPDNLCVSASEYSDASSESSDDARVNPEFLFYLRSLASRHTSIERYLEKAHRHYEHYAPSQTSAESEKREANDFVIDCVCEYNYDDRRMVQCESCGIRQHLDCMYTNPRQVPNFLKHRCHNCSDIKVDVTRAKAIQTSRKNWNLTAQYSERWHQRSKAKSEEAKKHKDAAKSADMKTEQMVSDGGKGTANTTNIQRVNKRKQDLKAYGAEIEKAAVEAVAPHVKMAIADEGSADDDKTTVAATAAEEASSDHNKEEVMEPMQHIHDYNANHHDNDDEDDPRANLNDMYSNEATTADARASSATALFSPIGEDYTERLALLNRRPQSFKKDYKEATKSVYTDKLLDKIKEMQESEEERKHLLPPGSLEGLDQGPEFLERNPRCRIVLFDGCTIGLEASVRLQSGSIVCALIGKMMLMEEYLKYTNPTTEYKQFVFLYHNFHNHGLVIDTSVYGNIVRYLRRSCDPNVKLEHTLISGNLYIVVRTTTDICQGVELTIPFDLPFEICQYPVQCACGKVRCPAVKHRRKHHRNRIITTSINCEQVIEDKLRELSQPLCGAPATYANPAKKPLINRYSYQPRSISDYFAEDAFDVKPPLSLSSHRLNSSKAAKGSTIIPESSIKIEEIEPPSFDSEPVVAAPEASPSKQIIADVSGSAILTTKRKPKPVQHPDFEMDTLSTRVTERGRGRTSVPVTPVKTKTEPSVKRMRTNSGSAVSRQPSAAAVAGKSSAGKEGSEFQSIITTRRQKMGKPAKIEAELATGADTKVEEKPSTPATPVVGHRRHRR